MSDDSQSTQYDPADYTVDEVNEYLAQASDEERERVLEAERNGENRKTVDGIEEDSGDGSDDENPVDENVREAQEEQTETSSKELGDDVDLTKNPNVPSSAVADVIATEMKSGESPTLDAVNSEAKNNEK